MPAPKKNRNAVKPDAMKRRESVQVYMTAVEKSQVAKAAKAEGRKLTEYARRKLLD